MVMVKQVATNFVSFKYRNLTACSFTLLHLLLMIPILLREIQCYQVITLGQSCRHFYQYNCMEATYIHYVIVSVVALAKPSHESAVIFLLPLPFKDSFNLK